MRKIYIIKEYLNEKCNILLLEFAFNDKAERDKFFMKIKKERKTWQCPCHFVKHEIDLVEDF